MPHTTGGSYKSRPGHKRPALGTGARRNPAVRALAAAGRRRSFRYSEVANDEGMPESAVDMPWPGIGHDKPMC